MGKTTKQTQLSRHHASLSLVIIVPMSWSVLSPKTVRPRVHRSVLLRRFVVRRLVHLWMARFAGTTGAHWHRSPYAVPCQHQNVTVWCLAPWAVPELEIWTPKRYDEHARPFHIVVRPSPPTPGVYSLKLAVCHVWINSEKFMTHLLTVSLVGRLTDCLEEGWEQIRLKASKSESPEAETELQMSIMRTLFLQGFL